MSAVASALTAARPWAPGPAQPAAEPGPQALLRRLFGAAVAAASPLLAVPPFLPRPPLGRTVVVGAGKAAAGMARAVEQHWPGPLEGGIVTRYGYGTPLEFLELMEAAHPVPDQAGVAASRRLLEMVRGLGPDDLVLALISGGGSALLTAPCEGLTLDDKQAVTRRLLACGAPIGEINTVRKHLSAIKGGRLAAAAAPAGVVTLVISDVPGDRVADVASAPTIPDQSTPEDALAIMARHGVDVPAAIAVLRRAVAAPLPALPAGEVHLVAGPSLSLAAASRLAAASGFEVLDLGGALEGDAEALGREHAALALRLRGTGRPVCILSGGETTVVVRGKGRGGRNAHYLLALLHALNGAEGIHAIAGDTDGIDGSEDNAGAILAPSSTARARAAGLDPLRCLAENDAYGFFAAIGGLVETGPTGTNVGDFRAILVNPPAAVQEAMP